MPNFQQFGWISRLPLHKKPFEAVIGFSGGRRMYRHAPP